MSDTGGVPNPLPRMETTGGTRVDPLEQRLWRIEHELSHHDRSLQEGVGKFKALREDIDAIRETLRLPLMKVMTVVVSVMLVVGAWIWQAARYPTRDEFERMRTAVEAMRQDQTRVQSDVNAIRNLLDRR